MLYYDANSYSPATPLPRPGGGGMAGSLCVCEKTCWICSLPAGPVRHGKEGVPARTGGLKVTRSPGGGGGVARTEQLTAGLPESRDHG